MIILDDAHYQSTAEQIAGLEAGRRAAQGAEDQGLEEWQHRLAADAYDSLITELRAQLREYDELKSGAVKCFSAVGFLQMPQVLVKARIARGLSVKDLAALLGTSEERVRNWELNDYQTASFIEMAEVAHVLEIDFSCQATLRDESSPSRRAPRRKWPLDRSEPVLTK